MPEDAPEQRSRAIERVSDRGSRPPRDPEPVGVMSLGDHLEELRKRIMFSIFGLLPLFITGLYFGKMLLAFLMTPMERALRAEGLNTRFLATSMFETFTTWIMVAFLVTLIFGLPWVLYQGWRFVAPGLYSHERRFVYVLMPLSITLSVAGVLFMYFLALPTMLAFFVHFTTNLEPPSPGPSILPPGVVIPSIPMLPGDPPEPVPGQYWFNETLGQIRMCIGMNGTAPILHGVALERSASIVQMPKLGEYLNQFLMLGVMFAAAFQAPVVVLLLGWVGIITVETLKKNRRMVIFIIAAIAAVVTPPDPISMLLLAVPLYILFEFGVLLLWLFPSPSRLTRSQREQQERESAGAEA
jgi:sec-independent protein translocase protein TatC